jgi:hypothetical protein
MTTKTAAPLLWPDDSDFTIAGWVYFNGGVTNLGGVLSNWNFTNGYSFHNASGNFVWAVRAAVLTSAAPVSAGVWYHFVCYHDSVANEIGMIINNGTPETLSHAGGMGGPSAAFGFQLHNQFNDTVSPDAIIDEVAVWGRRLTGAEIAELYNGGAGIGKP